MSGVIVHFQVLAESEDKAQDILDQLQARFSKQQHPHGWYEKTGCKFKIVCDQDPDEFEMLPDASTMMEAYDQGLDALGHSLVVIEPGTEDFDADNDE